MNKIPYPYARQEREAHRWALKFGAFVVGMLLLLFTVLAMFRWYRAGVQARVYERQGVRMSQWEVFIGATPVERPIKQAVEAAP